MTNLLGRKHTDLGIRFHCEVMMAASLAATKVIPSPSKQEIISKLREIQNCARELSEKIRDIDPMTRNLLTYGHMFIDNPEDPRHKGSLGASYNNPDGPPHWSAYDEDHEIYRRLVGNWVARATEVERSARAAVFQLGGGGRPPKPQIYNAVKLLKQVWDAHSTKEARLTYDNRLHKTRGPFLRFCEIALRPVSDEADSKMRLEGAVRKALQYGKRTMEKTKHNRSDINSI